MECGRTAFVSMADEVDREFEYFSKHYHWIKFFKSDENFFSQRYVSSFDNDISSFEVMTGLFTAGITQLLERIKVKASIYRENMTTIVQSLVERRDLKPFTPMSMQGTIQAFFLGVFSFTWNHYFLWSYRYSKSITNQACCHVYDMLRN